MQNANDEQTVIYGFYDFVFTFFVPNHVKQAGLLFGGMHAFFFFVFQQPFQHVKTHKLVHQKYMWYATFYQRSHLILTHFQRQINIFKTTFQHHFYVEFWRWNNIAFSTLLQLQYATIFQRWNGMIFNLRWFSGIDYLQLPFNTYSSKHILLTWIQPSCA